MYKKAARFSQRATRSNYNLEGRLTGPRKRGKDGKRQQAMLILKNGRIVPMKKSFYNAISALLDDLLKRGYNNSMIAAEFDRRDIRTLRGRQWREAQIGNLLARLRRIRK